MKVRYREEMANHSGPESCGIYRETYAEALTGDTGRPAIEPRNQQFGMPTELRITEGNTMHDENRKPCIDPTRSETLRMPGSFLHRNWEISSVSGAGCPDGVGKVNDHNPAIYAGEKSDTSVVPKKLPNNRNTLAEAVEGSDVTKGNVFDSPASRTQCRTNASMGLEGVREAARRNKRERFTALLHHVTPALLVESFYTLRKNAAAGVDGVTWREYEQILYTRVHELHREIHTGAYRTQPSRRVYIPKADGKQRPLGIASLEDKIVQQAVSTVLSIIYEEDFLGFSYGFRKGRGQHDALDALYMGITSRKVNWILDADIRAFFDEINHEWMLKFLEHRIADKRILRLIRKWLKAGVIEGGRRVSSEQGCPQGAVISPLLSNVYLHYVLDTWAHHWRKRYASGDVIIVRYADDSVLGFQHEGVAKRFLAAMQERLAKFGLALHPDKTRLIEFGNYAVTNRLKRGLGKPETFDFLGFTHVCARNKLGYAKLIRLTVKKRMRATLSAIRQTLLRRRHEPIAEIGRWLTRVVQGYFNYYAVSGNLYRLRSFRSEVCRTWRHALLQRSQRHHMPWTRFTRLVNMYIPPCRMVHPYPEQRFRATT
jgi:RNA-directed DNA polymerase